MRPPHPGLLRTLPFALALVVALVPWGEFESEDLPLYSVVAGIVLLMGLGIALRNGRELPLLCHPVVLFCAFMGQFYVIGPVAMTSLRFHSFAPLSSDRKLLVLALFVLLLVSFFAGFQVRLGEMLGRSLPAFHDPSRRLPAWMADSLLWSLALTGCVWYVVAAGGLSRLVESAYGEVQIPALFQLSLHLLLVATLVAGWRILGRQRPRLPWVGVFLVLLGIDAVFFGLLVGARKWLFYLFFGLVSLYLLRHGLRNLPRVRVGALMVTLLVFFSYWGGARTRSLTELMNNADPNPTYLHREAYMSYLVSVAEPFETAALVTRIFPSPEPYRLGSTMLVTILGFVPRAVWPGKPIGLGKDLTRYTDGVFYKPIVGHTVAPTLLGDFFANLGIAGVVIGGWLFGTVCRAAATYATEGMIDGCQSQPARVLLPAVFFAGLVEVRGESASILGFYALTMIPVLIVLMFFRMDFPHETRDA